MRLPTPIPITITPYFWLMAALIGFLWTQNLILTVLWIAIITVSVLVHELGHALTARYFGQHATITLVFFGGLTERRGGKGKLWQEFLITLNGPMAGFLLAFLAAVLSKRMATGENSLWAYVLGVTMLINFSWSVINLLPVLPLDGGKLMAILLEGVFGVAGVKAALLMSVFIGGGLGIIALVGLRQMVLAAVFFLLAFESYRGWRQSLQYSRKDADEELQQRLRVAEESFDRGDYDSSRVLLQDIRKKTARGVIHLRATQLLAAIASKLDQYQEAFDLLEPLKKYLRGPDLEMFHSIAFKCHQWQAVKEVANRVYQEVGGHHVALINAMSHAAEKEVEASVGWFRAALRDGLPNSSAELQRAEFNTIRNDPKFQALKAQVGGLE